MKNLILVLVFFLCFCTTKKIYENFDRSIIFSNYQTISDIGACQGITFYNNKFYLYGDAETGIIREYKFLNDKLEPTNKKIFLTKNGLDIISHPTGLAIDEKYGTFLGNTVRGKGEIYEIDFKKALKDENLDNSIIHKIEDKIAIQGTRPHYIQLKNKAYILTADYGNKNNQIRIYDLNTLKKLSDTNSKTLVNKTNSGPWVQNLFWYKPTKKLLLIQNITEGLGWKITTINNFTQANQTETYQEFPFPNDELEGLAIDENNKVVACSSSPKNNIWIGNYKDIN